MYYDNINVYSLYTCLLWWYTIKSERRVLTASIASNISGSAERRWALSIALVGRIALEG